ncbi:hypothetical protein [Mycobacterium sp. NPDC050853]|uniref:hypothetical protein n=1 Tax=Mycobacterium sp. NPDC050853 TaxID=3155160 RepID=UPI0033D1F21E
MNGDENSLLAQAHQLAKRDQQNEDDRSRQIFEGRVEQVARFVAKHSPGCSRALAITLGRSPEDPLFADRTWELSKVGEEEIDFNSDNALMIDSKFLPQLVTNLEGYAIGAHHFYESDRYTFGLTGMGHNWFGISDLASFGELTLKYPDSHKWSSVELSQYSRQRAES